MFYGDNARWFIGKVAKVDGDPSTTGRIKVRIFGIHDNRDLLIPDDLPWAQVVMPLTEGGGSGLGASTGIQPQSLVFGIFLDGKSSQLPLVIGSIVTNELYAQELALQGITPIDQRQGTGLTDQQSRNTRDTGVRITDASNPLSLNYQLTGNTNVEKAWNWFLSEEGGGFTPEQTAGLLGNFWVESANAGIPNDINPAAENSTQEASRGIAQWNPINKGQARGYVHPRSRLAGLIRHSESLSLNYLTLHAQLLWVTKELNSGYGGSQLRKDQTPETAARTVEIKYEIPAGYLDPNSESSPKRRQAARELYDQFMSTGAN